MDASGDEKGEQSQFMVAIEVEKKTNAGTLVRCSVAFGSTSLCLVGVGRPRFSKHGSFGSHHYLPTRSFTSWQALRQYADNRKFYVIGVSSSSACRTTSVSLRPFEGSTIFVSPTKGKTLTTEQLQACHFLVHVRVAGGPAADAAFSTLGGGLTLDTDVALSIVLHHFTAWSRYNTHRFCGQKYVKGQARKKGQFEDEEQQRLRNERRQQRLKADILSQPDTESTEVTNTVEVNQEAEEEVSIWSGFWGKGALAEK